MPSDQQGLFITGTDTGVGKTTVAAALVQYLFLKGRKIRVRKPVESGCPLSEKGYFPRDAHILQQAAHHQEPLDWICPWPLAAPISPERAAVQIGLFLTLADLCFACERGKEQNDFLVVEGAGGFLSPIAPGVRNAELAIALDLPILLVIADRLGCLNHTLLTVEAIKARGLQLAGVILNRVRSDPPTDNAIDLTKWLGRTVHCLPELPTVAGSALYNRLSSDRISAILTAIFTMGAG